MSLRAEMLSVGIDVTAVPGEPVGAGRYTIELVKALARRSDLETTVFSRRSDELRWTDLQNGIEETFHVVARAPRSRPLRLAYGELGLARDVRHAQRPIDCFHGPHYQLPRHLDRPGVVTVHDLTFIDHPEWHERSKVFVFSRALRQVADRADVVICVSHQTADAFSERFHPRGEVRVVMHGVDHERFNGVGDSGEDEQLRRAVGIAGPYLLHLGTIEPRKNIPNLIRAFDHLADSHSDLELVLAGQLAWGSDELNSALADSHVSDRVRQLGYVADELVAPLLRGAAAVAYPSIEEGFGLPALEALACGSPLVTTRDSVMAEFAGDAALLIDPDDVDGLTQALESLLVEGTDHAERRSKGIERAAQFTWDRTAQGHLDAYGLALGL